MTEPTLLAAVPPMEWIEGEATFMPGATEPLLVVIVPGIHGPYFQPHALWAEPVDGLRIVRFQIGPQSWSCGGPVPLALFRLAVIDLSGMPAVSTMAMAEPACAMIVGEAAEPVTVRVLIGGRHPERLRRPYPPAQPRSW